jgi:hypothetical protein
MVVKPSPRVTIDFLHFDDARDENDYSQQVIYTIQEHLNVKISSS